MIIMVLCQREQLLIARYITSFVIFVLVFSSGTIGKIYAQDNDDLFDRYGLLIGYEYELTSVGDDDIIERRNTESEARFFLVEVYAKIEQKGILWPLPFYREVSTSGVDKSFEYNELGVNLLRLGDINRSDAQWRHKSVMISLYISDMEITRRSEFEISGQIEIDPDTGRLKEASFPE